MRKLEGPKHVLQCRQVREVEEAVAKLLEACRPTRLQPAQGCLPVDLEPAVANRRNHHIWGSLIRWQRQADVPSAAVVSSPASVDAEADDVPESLLLVSDLSVGSHLRRYL